jgi:hypothetical protein
LRAVRYSKYADEARSLKKFFKTKQGGFQFAFQANFNEKIRENLSKVAKPVKKPFLAGEL